MGLVDLLTKARRDPLGPAWLNVMRSNLNWLQQAFAAEHMTSGEHNAIEVPRLVTRIDYSAGTYSASPTTTDITSITHPATGRIVINLASGRFDSSQLVCQLNCADSDSSTKPYNYAYKVVSSTQIEVYQKKLSSALGAGNVWAAADAKFDLAIHSTPLSVGTWANALPSALSGRDNTLRATFWNALLQVLGDTRAAFSVAHDTSTGEHNVKEVARAWSWVQYVASGTKYVSTEGTGITTLTRTGTGVVELDHASWTTPTMGFPCPDYERLATTPDPTDLVIVNAVQTSATRTTCYLFRYDRSGNTWAAADADFWIHLHGS